MFGNLLMWGRRITVIVYWLKKKETSKNCLTLLVKIKSDMPWERIFLSHAHTMLSRCVVTCVGIFHSQIVKTFSYKLRDKSNSVGNQVLEVIITARVSLLWNMCLLSSLDAIPFDSICLLVGSNSHYLCLRKSDHIANQWCATIAEAVLFLASNNMWHFLSLRF